MAGFTTYTPEEHLSPPLAKKNRPENPIADAEIPCQISNWTKSELNFLGLFYEKDHVKDLDFLLNMTFSYDSKIPHLPPKCKLMFKVLEYFLDFSANEYQEKVPKNIDKVTRFKEDVCRIKSSLAKMKEATFENVQHLFQKDLSADENFLRGMFEATKWNCIYGFGEKLLYFMLESRKGSTNEKMYRQLYRDFFLTCGLHFMDGECKQKSMKIGRSNTSSQPALRCCDCEITELDMKTVIFVGGVKQRQGTLPASNDFRIEHLDPYNILAQHGGELLLEIQDSCFEKTDETHKNDQRIVFGAMCVGTQVIFTALEMSKKHIDLIKEMEEETIVDKDDIGRSLISYTRPYNLLNASDRSKLYEPLLRLACYQKKF